MYLCNSFSLNMLAQPAGAQVSVKPIAAEEVGELVTASAIGHADTAAIVSDEIGMVVPPFRRSLQLEAGDEIVVAQYIGPRLPEGSTSLPSGARIDYFVVSIG